MESIVGLSERIQKATELLTETRNSFEEQSWLEASYSAVACMAAVEEALELLHGYSTLESEPLLSSLPRIERELRRYRSESWSILNKCRQPLGLPPLRKKKG